MPRTRNIARLQENNPAPTLSRNRDENVADKENNGGRTTRATRALHRPAGILGTITPSLRNTLHAQKNTTATTTNDIKKKKKPTKAPKREKLPLQDITSQFLPAPEAANRGEGFQLDQTEPQPVEDVIAAQADDSIPQPALQSPLPPSSPPSDLYSPVFAPQVAEDTGRGLNDFAQQSTFPSWEDFIATDSVAKHSPSSAESRSDPFGFVALERKLKEERAVSPIADGEFEADLPVADTDSPRPVRRLKRSARDDGEGEGEGEDAEVSSDDIPLSLHQVHFMTPPTPHKDKKKRPRLSHEGHNIFSPCCSSVESTPSPSKASARKPAQQQPDLLGDFNADIERSQDVIPPPTSVLRRQPTRSVKPVSHSPAVLFPRAAKLDEDDQSKARRAKSASVQRKRTVGKKARSVSPSKKGPKDEEEVDLVEKFEQERLERIKYFKRLEGYEVEKEDVYLI